MTSKKTLLVSILGFFLLAGAAHAVDARKAELKSDPAIQSESDDEVLANVRTSVVVKDGIYYKVSTARVAGETARASGGSITCTGTCGQKGGAGGCETGGCDPTTRGGCSSVSCFGPGCTQTASCTKTSTGFTTFINQID